MVSYSVELTTRAMSREVLILVVVDNGLVLIDLTKAKLLTLES